MVTSVGYAVGGRSWTNERAAVREADRIMVRYDRNTVRKIMAAKKLCCFRVTE